VKEFMGLNTAAWDAFRATVTRLANIEMHEEHAADVAVQVFGGGEKVRETAGFKKVMSLFNGDGMGAMMDGVFGTRWGFLNAVTEYADHHVRAHNDQNRFVAAQWGTGAALKARTLELLAA
jgi:hypothetical protein